MSMKYFLGLALIIAIGWAALSENPNNDTRSENTENGESISNEEKMSQEEKENGSGDTSGSLSKDNKVSNIDGQQYTRYENKAVQYSIQRPTNWYWEHFHKDAIGNMKESIDDLLVLDRKPLEGLSTEPLGKIVLEISKKNAGDLSGSVSGLESESVVVGGIESNKYSGEKDGSYVIEYHVLDESKTCRFIYQTKERDSTEEEIFNTFVHSINFED